MTLSREITEELKKGKGFARIVRVEKGKTLSKLATDPGRNTAFGIGYDWFENRFNLEGYQMILAVGYSHNEIVDYLDKGIEFTLVVIPAGPYAMLATAENILKAMEQANPAFDAPYFLVDELKQYGGPAGYKKLEAALIQKTGKTFDQLKKDEPMTYDAYRDSDQDILSLRRLLNDTERCSALCGFNGRILSEAGADLGEEFIVVNVPVDRMGKYYSAPLNVTLPGPKITSAVSRKQGLHELPIPSHFDLHKADKVWRVSYSDLAPVAKAWAIKHGLTNAVKDRYRICLMPIDAQNTFCIPGFELFVGGQSGFGAVEDNVRMCEFIYRNLGLITEITPTLDTHTAMQIFHPIFWVNEKGEHPVGNETMITLDDVERGFWKVNPAIAYSVAGDASIYQALQAFALHYVRSLTKEGKYALMIWTYHAMLGGVGHALASVCEEAFFFHNMARNSQTGFEIKGGNPLTENYSVLRPEVLDGPNGSPIAQKNAKFFKKLLSFDVVIIAGQAKSHCVAWTIDDLLNEIVRVDKNLAQKIYLLEDCTSPVVIPGIIDFTKQADEAFDKFKAAGMHVVKSTTPIEDWPGIRL